ncbi:MAG: beta-galactosidase [Prolixibacteraceae bacterium]
MKHIFLFAILISGFILSFAQTIEIDARNSDYQLIEGDLRMGNAGPVGSKIKVNNKYLTYADEPILPVMGEVHFTRIPREKWEETILKMKANGITIIAYYIFWIHHEEIEGQFNWGDNYDVKAFTALCQKHGLWAYPRLGPWCHGEVRNGGLPDWLMQKENIKLRSNDPAYLSYAEKWYSEIGHQLKGLFYKDGGPIIGIQLENEYWRGKGGESHILWLKQTAQKYGIDVPLYTVTGWRNASVPEKEVIPLWGGYPAAPWNTNLKKITKNESYLFQQPINDESIGHKENNDKYTPDYSLYPYLTCELGIGNQLSEHRRPIIDPIDGLAIASANLASGSNLPGYYVFAGGLNPVGKLTTLEEDRWESGYWNEYPDISYDFQAAIRETGEIAPSYQQVKSLHYFLNEFGSLLAPMQPMLPENNNDPDDLQYSFRTNGSSGFLFVSNYSRGFVKSTKNKVKFELKLKDETLSLPTQNIDIADSTIFIWPVNFMLNNITLKYATAQPICNISTNDTITWFFKATNGIPTEFLFSNKEVENVRSNGATIIQNENSWLIKDVKSGLNNPVFLNEKEGLRHRIFVLSEKQSQKFWHFKDKENELAFWSTANLTLDEKNQLRAFSTHQNDTIVCFNSQLSLINTTNTREQKTSLGLQQIILDNPEENPVCTIAKADLINDCQWIQLNPGKYDSRNELYHIQLFKEFSIENTAAIRKATLYLLGDVSCKMNVNKRWVNQEMQSGQVSLVDLTTYLSKGSNQLMFDFPYTDNETLFKATLEVEFYNSDKVIIGTDSSWTSVIQYKIPAPWDHPKTNLVSCSSHTPERFQNSAFTLNRFALSVDAQSLLKYKNAYLRINYEGNKAQCRSGQNLIADNFNNGTLWSINLNSVDFDQTEPLIIEIEPWHGHEEIYFDKVPQKVKGSIQTTVQPEHHQLFSFYYMNYQ